MPCRDHHAAGRSALCALILGIVASTTTALALVPTVASAVPPSGAAVSSHHPNEIAYTMWGKKNPSLWLAHADGTHRRRLSANADSPVWSPDGRHLAYRNLSDGASLWVMGADGSHKHRVGNDAYNPFWSPDSQMITYDVGDNGTTDWAIWTARANGSGNRRIAAGDSPVWSPDGAHIASRRRPAACA